jgi:hypothetical protein
MFMPVLTDVQQRWHVRPTLRLPGRLPDQATGDRLIPLVGGIADALRQRPNVAYANVGFTFYVQSVGISAGITLAHPATPGAAVDEATRLLSEACAAAGLATDLIIEVVVAPADLDHGSL